MSDVVIVSAGIAGGHDGVARELARRVRLRGFSAEVLDLIDLLPAMTGSLARELYRMQLRAAPATWARMYESFDRPRPSRLADLVVSLAARALADAVDPRAKIVVSTYPLAGQALGRLRARGALGMPAIAYLTDMSVHRLWVADGVELHLAVHAAPAEAAVRLGAARVHVVAPAVRPATGPLSSSARAAARAGFGLPTDRRLALVTGGSWGVGELAATVADIRASGAADPVVVCGDNQRLASRVRASGTAHVLGWIDDLPTLLAACDVVLQNAGGLTSLEAFAARVPVISYRCVPGHGLANSRVLAEQGLAPLASSPSELAVLLGQSPTRCRSTETLFDAPDPAEVIIAHAVGRATARPWVSTQRRGRRNAHVPDATHLSGEDRPPVPAGSTATDSPEGGS